jgi:hypothetical protein
VTGQLHKHAHAALREHCVFVAVNVDKHPPPVSAIKPEWRHLRHCYASSDQLAIKQLGIEFIPQSVVIGKGGAMVAARKQGVKNRLRGREIADLLLSLIE